MATETGPAPVGDRRVLVVALVLLGGVTGIVFGRVFLGTHPAVRLAAAGVAAVLIATGLSRRSLGLSLLASAVGLLLALGLLVFPRTTWAGLPTPETFRALLRALRLVTDRAATEVAPATPVSPLMTAAVMAVWSAATAAHALAVRSGSAVLPLLPGAALLAFAGVVTEDPPRPGYVLLFLAAAFAVLFAEAIQGTTSWDPSASRSRTIFSGRWARALGAIAALSAVAIPGVLPGFGGKGLLDVGGPGQRIDVNPIVDIRPSLLQNPPADLFRIRASRPAYWRLVVLDRFDGHAWTQGESSIDTQQRLSPGVQNFLGPVPAGSLVLHQQVEIEQLGATWLPAAAEPVEVQVPDDFEGRHDNSSGVITLAARTSEGMSYTVTSAVPRPPLVDLDAILPQNPGSDPRYTALPANMPQRIRQLALEMTAGAVTPFDQILAIQEHLRTFTYDESVPAGHGTDAILHFLEASRRGYCEQFAGTMAVLVRSLGYPARVAIGFLPGDRDKAGWNQVTTAQVHAWPEVYFGDFGWLAFEPTPSRENPTANYLVHLPSGPHPDANLGSNAKSQSAGPGSLLRRKDELQGAPTVLEPVEPARRGAGRRQPFPWRTVALVALLLAGVILLLIPPAKAIGRRLALSRARDGRHRVLAAYAWLLDGASDLGLGRKRWETLLEYQARMRSDRRVSAEALDRLTRAAGRALYSQIEPGYEHGEQAVTDARTLLRELRRGSGRLRALAGAVRPSSR